ncbi:TolC family protein [Geobacter hydrogenophilus]|uniref:RND transporter n=1 Tax=Geobacter hydrogenophilus TaxID=40983 RepID=A0A9W6G142_9BACT|nr:TolC family protein [Geobacter hydrogenophilus]MBT0893253.1 TolC family protein [Geobacter hydrogenophilus]GLI38900.1 RND transporter [Geobacter hydrogenophilus]
MKRMCAALCLCLVAAPAFAAEGQISLPLAEAVRSAVEKNLDVKAELYNPAMAQADIRKNEGIYDTTLRLATDFNYSVTEPASSFLTGSLTNRQKTFDVNPGISQLIPIGGTLGVTFNNTYNSNNSTRSFNNYWNSDLTVNLTQPLLKNFGREPTELAIMVARNSRGESLERFRTTLSDTVARVRNEYFKLYSLRGDLEVKTTSLLLARKILDDTKARVKAGVLPAMEILNAEFGVASREKDLIDAEKAVRDQNDVLRVLLQLPGREEIVPVDMPTKEPFAVNEKEMVKRALDNRSEIREQLAALKSRELEMRVAHNRTLPDLNLSASAALTGLDAHYNRDMEKIGSADYPVWGVGLQFAYPLGNNAAENDYIRSKLRLEQAKTQVRSLEANVENDVKAAIRGVESGYKQIDVTERGRAFAEERLRSFIKKNEVGLATTKDVLDVENDLAAAKINQINALVGYTDAITQLWRTTGEILDRTGVQLSDTEGDSLYERHAHN